MVVFGLVAIPRLLDVDADLSWGLGLILVAVIAVIIGWWILLRPPTR